MRPYYLLQAKKPSESKYPFDYLKLLATVSPEDAARPLSKSGCPMVTPCGDESPRRDSAKIRHAPDCICHSDRGRMARDGRTDDGKTARTHLHRLQETLRVRRQPTAVRTRGKIRRRTGVASLHAAHRRIHGKGGRAHTAFLA